MAPKSKHVVFDVVGTCVSFDAYFGRIDEVLGPRLRERNITAKHFGFSWMTASELEFTFLSISENYTAYKHVLKAMFYRTLWMAGVEEPRKFATDDERDRCIEGYSLLQARDGCADCFKLLRDNGYTVWAFTTGDVTRVRGYFQRAGIDMPIENFISCDNVGVAKPALAAYRSVLSKFDADDETWFAAGHMWDVAAAVRAGFKGAYTSVYEKEDCEELFGVKMSVKAPSLPELAKGIVES
ncbi:HAD-like protein [Myriangium duriaei CBS 260.36]|uniref:HAD-like protein n=1 Tax=Myriangium duriaei CBS 260.36 TaxID=1168546 RepID=A0A9P4IYM0_9PEZI|nr:HAD-like protein [Myriangium duriaei CBS 260.36]